MATVQAQHPVTEPPSLDAFGARLAIIRWAMRWNIKEAALACNLAHASWREWELFDRTPRNLVDVAAKIASRTGYDDYWIMTGKTKAPAVSDEGPAARPEGFEPPTFCLAVGGEPLAIANRLPVSVTTPDSGAVVIDITDRLPHNPGTPELGGGAVADVITLPTWRNRPSVIREAVAR